MCSWITSIAFIFMFLCFCKTCFIWFVLITTSLFVCVTFIIILFWFNFHFTHNIHCFLECFQVLIVLNRVLNIEFMYRLPIFSPIWSSHKKHCWPCFKCIFLYFNFLICIIHLIKFFFNSLVVSKKNYPERFLRLNSSLCSFLA